MPDHLQQYRRTWQTLHPDWGHWLWGEADLRWLRNQALYDRAEKLAPGSEGQLRSDLARYEILHRHGGLYVDCDMEALRPFDPLMEAECFAGYEDDRWVNNAVLGAVPGHPLLAKLVVEAPRSIARNAGRRPNRMTGPHLLTRLCAGRKDVTLHPREAFYPYSYKELDRQGEEFPDSWAAHHWDNQRKRAA